ncbi:hypothetical protein LTR94_034497, partial [Friedmanniomyces endolithicus]
PGVRRGRKDRRHLSAPGLGHAVVRLRGRRQYRHAIYPHRQQVLGPAALFGAYRNLPRLHDLHRRRHEQRGRHGRQHLPRLAAELQWRLLVHRQQVPCPCRLGQGDGAPAHGPAGAERHLRPGQRQPT